VRSVLRLAGPVAVARLGVMGMAVADVVMVGQLAPKELPLQALGWAPVGVLLLAGIGLLTGVQVLTAHAVGAGDPRAALVTLRKGVLLGLGAGLASAALLALTAAPILALLGVEAGLVPGSAAVARVLALSVPLQLVFVAGSYFLEGVQRPNGASVIMWAANIANIGFNWLLIPELGAVGSAWATVLSRLLMALALLCWIALLPGRSSALGSFRQLSPGLGPRYANLLRIGGAAALSQAAEAGAFNGMTIIAGRIGAQAVAAYQILLNGMAILFMVALGFASAGAVLTAEARGAGDPARARRAAWTSAGLNSAFMLAAGLGWWLAPWLVAGAYTPDRSLQALIVAATPAAALALLPDGAQVVMAQTLRASGDNWFPTGSHILCYVLVMPPLGWWLAERLGRGAAGLMEAILWASVLSAVVLGARQWTRLGPAAREA
jgi:MATE family multidrug resistance protein